MKINLRRSLFIMFLISVFCIVFRRPIGYMFEDISFVKASLIGFYIEAWLFGVDGWYDGIPNEPRYHAAASISMFMSIAVHTVMFILTTIGVVATWKRLG